MTVHAYHDLPVSIRPRHLEQHTGWPKRWTAPDPDTAINTLTAIIDVINRGGLLGQYRMWIEAGDTATDVVVDRVGGGRDSGEQVLPLADTQESAEAAPCESPPA